MSPVPAFRPILLLSALTLIHPALCNADPITIRFTAQVGAGNNIDTENVFGEGLGANLAGQIIAGSATIDPAALTQLCTAGDACYGDFGAGAVSVSFNLNGVTSTVVSIGTIGYFGGRSGGMITIGDRASSGDNYMAIGATTADGMVQECIGALFDDATVFDAYGDGDPATAIASLGRIGDGAGLVNGGITFLSPVEHLDATILGIDIPEPAGSAMFDVGLLLLAAVRRRVMGRSK